MWISLTALICVLLLIIKSFFGKDGNVKEDIFCNICNDLIEVDEKAYRYRGKNYCSVCYKELIEELINDFGVLERIYHFVDNDKYLGDSHDKCDEEIITLFVKEKIVEEI